MVLEISDDELPLAFCGNQSQSRQGGREPFDVQHNRFAPSGWDQTHHAAHRMAMKRVRIVARLAMITTNQKISRCDVVIDDDALKKASRCAHLKCHEYLPCG